MLHLAMHAWVEDEKSAYSQLLFTPGADSANDQRLYAGGIV